MTTPGLDIRPAPTWHGRLAQPVRHVLLRLLAPMMSRFLIAHDELMTAYAEQALSLEDAQRRIDWLTDEVSAANALAWDQVAFARRLAELEDGLSQRDGVSEADSIETDANGTRSS